ncbi:976d47c4-e8f8-41cf-8ce7-d5f82dc88eee [Sclerotinia trifoliorum]|uniref:976d47c4-e8f8-41cf-8ce7-d5f82dc88eee n=1 Tax=Sclerotinia trifoliorum TaxID=28548 RepID=A0A8H2VP10_9HELO|nr:976d47c4-e8f8-41cf-8ce7-d5f82dc88eee [Sclerotinia trifoliorum]
MEVGKRLGSTLKGQIDRWINAQASVLKILPIQSTSMESIEFTYTAKTMDCISLNMIIITLSYNFNRLFTK